MNHTFLFTLSNWTGQGIVSFKNVKDDIHFKVSWDALFMDAHRIIWKQTVCLAGISEPVVNTLEIKRSDLPEFEIVLQTIDFKTAGSGTSEGDEISWHYQGNLNGKESFIREGPGRYRFYAHYIYPDEETRIEGYIETN